jgi:hypothetical protein
VKIGAVATDEFSQLNEFRVTLSATEDFGRTAKATIYFNNWQAAGLLSQATNCIHIKATHVATIPPWQWGISDPLRSPYDPARDGNIAVRDPTVVAHANLFMNLGPQKGAFLAPRSQVAIAGAVPSDISKLVTQAPAQRPERILGPVVSPGVNGLATSRKGAGDFGAHIQMQNIRATAPLLGASR